MSKKEEKQVFAVDFDGTMVSHEFPLIGKDIGAVPVLRKLIDNGHKIILYTMRSDKKEVKSKDYNIHQKGSNYLTQAVNWCKANNIPLYGIQTNPSQKNWTDSPKCYANRYIDDAAIGIPLKIDKNISKNPFVDWTKTEKLLKDEGFIKL